MPSFRWRNGTPRRCSRTLSAGASGDPIAAYILDAVTERAVTRARAYARAGVDILYLGDDIGMQKAPMMSLELYCKWLKPRLKQVIDAARAIRPGILVKYHSCGYATPFIPHLIEAGVDILNPIQPESMNFQKIYREFGGKISFDGTIGTQSVKMCIRDSHVTVRRVHRPYHTAAANLQHHSVQLNLHTGLPQQINKPPGIFRPGQFLLKIMQAEAVVDALVQNAAQLMVALQ